MSQSNAVTTALLSDKQRAFLRGEREDELKDPEQYERKVRHQARQRVEMLRRDLELLETNDHEDIVAMFYWEVSRIERLRDDLREHGGDGG